jgi:hypothetical protein
MQLEECSSPLPESLARERLASGRPASCHQPPKSAGGTWATNHRVGREPQTCTQSTLVDLQLLSASARKAGSTQLLQSVFVSSQHAATLFFRHPHGSVASFHPAFSLQDFCAFEFLFVIVRRCFLGRQVSAGARGSVGRHNKGRRNPSKQYPGDDF